MHRLIISTIICLLATASFAAEPVATDVKQTITTPSGLEYTSLGDGSGASPGPADTVRVNYRGTLLNGREFDSSYKRGKPAELF